MMNKLQSAFKQSAYLRELAPFSTEMENVDEGTVNYNISEKALYNKLSSLRLTKQNYEHIIRNYPQLIENHLPEWVQVLRKITAYDPKAVSHIKYELPHKSFVTYFTPFILYVQNEMEDFFKSLSRENSLVKTKIDIHQYMECVISIIHSDIDKLSTKMLIAELNIARMEGSLKGSDGEERYIYFVEQYLGDSENFAGIFEVYPVLGRVLCERLVQLIEIHKTLVKHFLMDYETIEETFGFRSPRLTGVKGDLGDSHKKGRSVEIIETTAGKLVYKPRSLAVDSHFTEIVAWVNASGVKHSLRAAKVLDREQYGWQEFIQYDDCIDEAQIQRFFYRQGMNVALLYAFRSVDFHNENLIAAGEYPILIDLETLFDNQIDLFQNQNQLHITALELKNSVLSSMMLPVKFNHDQALDYDLSGIAGRGGQKSKRNKGYTISNFGTDAMAFVETELVTKNKLNVPAINGQDIQIFDYKEYLLEGFRDTYRSIESHKFEFESLLNMFSKDEVRHVFRPTHVYGKFLEASTHPKYLQRGIDREGLFDYMWSITEWSELANVFVRSEINDLVVHDIPYFTFLVGGKHLYNSAGKEYRDFYKESSLALTKSRIRSFSEADRLKQERYISLSLATLIDNVWNGISEQPAELPTPVHLRDEIVTIADGMLAKALYDKKGRSPFWISTSVGNEDDIFLSPLPPGVYDGIGGIAIFYAQLGVFLKSAEYERTAKSILNVLMGEEKFWLANMDSTSAFFGIGAFVYVYSYLGCLWNDSSLLHRAVGLLPAIEKLLPLEEEIDIIRGHAGLLKVLANLYRAYPADEVIRVLQILSERYLQQIRNTVIHSDSGRSAGFAHGISGIAFSLAHVYCVLPSSDIQRTIMKLVEIENRFYVGSERKWLDLRENKHALAANYWCHGSYGILLARAHIHALLPSFPAELLMIDRLLNDLSETEGATGHSMCHGELGNRNVLLDVHRLLQGAKLAGEAEWMQLNKTPDRPWRTGMHPDIESLGLFTGISGIAFGMLRLLDPEIPSILALDIPLNEVDVCS
ncbi:type 2 lantibiotic biosynthesis protein LanM [Paenibacillus sophorae]|uniref:Type 2 lantibiotic biosynthesis protein LanM n=1 Tax=Paenibacillus sophorae TaxID=1333845 RepID=A0A1H8ILW2_9BACL|nr:MULTISPECIES: type 2 lanthipeptide synthetase LanM family protein [Paenibacillus]QWU15999.1 type 2 lantipeptide synthetase LanM family protein [Paenibacillus sophorae]SEN69125.1 type 2 lantibiotic biosynthesis protein LanM [Paenibacillus sophorae]